MLTIQIEHAITDFETWKTAFDRDPIDRARSGVRAHRIYRPIEDDQRVIIELDVTDREAAELIKTKLANLWQSGAAAPALGDATPEVRLFDNVEQFAV